MTDCRKFSASTNDIKALVSDVIEGRIIDYVSYDTRFLEVSIKVCDDINSHPQKDGEGCFTFGNAQKLINIVMKYFYLHSFGNKEEKAYFQFCHCPMDQQLLEEVWSRRTELSEDTKKALGKRMEFLKSWGNEDFSCNDGKKDFPERYKVFQKAVAELSKDNSPLEFDYFIWGNEN